MQVFILHEKHGTRIVTANNLEEAAIEIVHDRFGEDYWYYNWDDGNPKHQWHDRAREIIAHYDGASALRFLNERKDHEYEGYEIQNVEVVS